MGARIRATRTDLVRRALPYVAALLPFLALALWRFSSGPGLTADDYAQYRMHAHALAEGRPYGDIDYIYSPYARWVGPRLAMPGLPILLAGVEVVFGANVVVMKAVVLCFAVAFIALAGLYFARHADRRLGLGVLLLLGLSPSVVHGSTQLLTDLPFTALIWAVIVLMDAPGQLSARRLAAVTVLGGAALLFRTAGLALIPALTVLALVRYREQKLRPLVPVLVWLAALLLASIAIDIRETTVLRLSPERFLVWLRASQFGMRHGLEYAQALLDSHLHPFPWAVANDVFHAITVVIMLLGLGEWVIKSPVRFSVVFAIAYGGLLLIAPVSDTRYMWPLFPFFVFGLLNGIKVILDRFFAGRVQPVYAVLAFAAVLALGGVRAVVAAPRPGNLMAMPDVADVVSYVRRAAAQQPVRVSFYKPRSFALATGVPTMGPIGGEPPCVLAELDRRRITHIIVGAKASREEAATGRLKDLAPTRPDLFTLEHRNQTFIVYSYHGPAAVPLEEQQACPVH